MELLGHFLVHSFLYILDLVSDFKLNRLVKRNCSGFIATSSHSNPQLSHYSKSLQGFDRLITPSPLHLGQKRISSVYQQYFLYKILENSSLKFEFYVEFKFKYSYRGVNLTPQSLTHPIKSLFNTNEGAMISYTPQLQVHSRQVLHAQKGYLILLNY